MPGFKELLIILVVVLIIFGAGRLKNIGKDLGDAIKNFKEGMSDKSDKKDK
jgi:sec-independent protein translocase protein TatA